MGYIDISSYFYFTRKTDGSFNYVIYGAFHSTALHMLDVFYDSFPAASNDTHTRLLSKVLVAYLINLKVCLLPTSCAALL